MLLIDGVRYHLWHPEKEEDLENIVKEHFQEIFGQDAVLFDKSKLQTHFKEATIPDGYIIHLGKPGWSILEVELSKHPLHDHITLQLIKFIDAIKSQQNRQNLIQELNATIRNNAVLKEEFKANLGDREIYEFLTQVISQEPTLVIVIEEKTPELESAISQLRLPTKIVELKTYVREDVGIAVHAHLFKPLVKEKKPAPAPAPKPSNEPIQSPVLSLASPTEQEIDTVVVPALEDGLNETFLGESRWYAVRIHQTKMPLIKYIAAYQVAPVSAITHVAKVESIKPYKGTKKFVINFTEKAQKIGPIPLVPKKNKGKMKALQNLRYTSFAKLSKAKTLDEVF